MSSMYKSVISTSKICFHVTLANIALCDSIPKFAIKSKANPHKIRPDVAKRCQTSNSLPPIGSASACICKRNTNLTVAYSFKIKFEFN